MKNPMGRNEVLAFIKEHIGERPFTCKGLEKALIEKVGEDRLPGSLSATVSNMARLGITVKMKKPFPKALQVYKLIDLSIEDAGKPVNNQLGEHPPESADIKDVDESIGQEISTGQSDNKSTTTTKGIENKRKKITTMPNNNIGTKKRPRIWNMFKVLGFIKKNYPYPKPIDVNSLKNDLGLKTTQSSRQYLFKLALAGELDELRQKGSYGTTLYRCKPTFDQATKIYQDASRPPGQAAPAQPNPDVATRQENPENESSGPKLVELTPEVFEALGLPLSLIGKAILIEIRDLKREKNTLQDENSGLNREIGKLRDRIGEQYKQIEKLNALVAQLNPEKKSAHSQDSITRLSDIAKFGSLKTGSSFK